MMDVFPVFDLYAPLTFRHTLDDARFANLTQAVLRSTPAACRLIGAVENDKAAFLAFTEKLYFSIGSPLEEYIQAVLSVLFGIDTKVSPDTAEEIWAQTASMLRSPDFSFRSILKRCNVRSICVPFPPLHDLRALRAFNAAHQPDAAYIRPVFDASAYLDLSAAGYADRISALSTATGTDIQTMDSLLHALDVQMDFFYAAGCRSLLIDAQPFAAAADEKKADKALCNALAHIPLKRKDTEVFRACLLRGLSLLCVKKNWYMHVRIQDATLTGKDISGFFSHLSSLRQSGALPKALIACRSAEQLSAVAALLEDTGARLNDLVSPALSAEYGSGELIRQASVLSQHSLLHHCMGIVSGTTCAAGLAAHSAMQKKLAGFFSTLGSEERTAGLMRRLCVEQPMRLLMPARQDAPAIF